MILRELNGKLPKYGENCFFAETATLVGDVEMGDDCSLWYGAVLRGDVHYIKLGNKVNVQDNATIHGTYQKAPTNIGNNVSIGHNAVVHGCTIHDNVLIGMGAIILDGCVIEPYSIVAAGAVLTKNTVVPSGTVYAGTPAKKIKDIGPDLLKGEVQRIAESYLKYSGWYK
ncbi:gamma carbonic anhydrase family protein [Desulforhopalus vacuolatus]|uniref:gamma carbonic anhydrase family protein n=1 Tax=Desulforhopalus vacuolatus TaxID=40414 RepID=UPI0019646894|nr:gamma carbonic anhydrase family protein [Desulforhopalus vacuolatus]MBM9518627.1 gamma carbonic anhydrase family protein [Desulforhopalus vacuolatus]